MSAYRTPHEPVRSLDYAPHDEEFNELYQFWLDVHGTANPSLFDCLRFLIDVWLPMGGSAIPMGGSPR